MGDDDETGGSPVCYLDEVDPAYAGYLTGATLTERVAVLRALARAALAVAAQLRSGAPPDTPWAELVDDLSALEAALSKADGDMHSRFAPPADSPPSRQRLADLVTALIALLEASLPRIVSDALHGTLNQALSRLRDHRARLGVA